MVQYSPLRTYPGTVPNSRPDTNVKRPKRFPANTNRPPQPSPSGVRPSRARVLPKGGTFWAAARAAGQLLPYIMPQPDIVQTFPPVLQPSIPGLKFYNNKVYWPGYKNASLAGTTPLPSVLLTAGSHPYSDVLVLSNSATDQNFYGPNYSSLVVNQNGRWRWFRNWSLPAGSPAPGQVWVTPEPIITPQPPLPVQLPIGVPFAVPAGSPRRAPRRWHSPSPYQRSYRHNPRSAVSVGVSIGPRGGVVVDRMPTNRPPKPGLKDRKAKSPFFAAVAAGAENVRDITDFIEILYGSTDFGKDNPKASMADMFSYLASGGVAHVNWAEAAYGAAVWYVGQRVGALVDAARRAAAEGIDYPVFLGVDGYAASGLRF